MSTSRTVRSTTPADREGQAAPSPAGLTQRRVMASEWVKLRGLRSITWAALSLVLAILGGGAFSAVGVVVKATPPTGEVVAPDPSAAVLAGVPLAQLAVVALGALVVTSEYRNKAIRASLTAVPTRLPLVWGKAAVAGAITVMVSLPAVLLTFVVADLVLGIDGLSVALTDPGVARALGGTTLTLGLTAVLATGFGWMVRSTAGAVSLLIALLYLLPSLAVWLPPAMAPYLPNNAVAAVAELRPGAQLLPPWAGLAVYGGYTVLALAAAALLVRRRDA